MNSLPTTARIKVSDGNGVVYFAYLVFNDGVYSLYSGDYSINNCRDVLTYGMQKVPIDKRLHEGRAAIFVGTSGNITRIMEVLHHAEEGLKIPTKTEFFAAVQPGLLSPLTTKDNNYIALIDPIWVERYYMLSLWSLLVRISSHNYKEGLYSYPGEFLRTFHGDKWIGYTASSPYPAIGVKDKYKYFVKNGIYISKTESTDSHMGITNIVVPGLTIESITKKEEVV